MPEKNRFPAVLQPILSVVHGTQDPCTLNNLAFPLGRNNGGENAVCVTGDLTHTLTSEGHDASEDGTGRGNPIVAYGFQPRIARNGRGDMGDIVSALNAQSGDIVSALNAQSGETGKGDAAPCVATNMAVRRLMPVECERLQGFPDGHTNIPVAGKPAADGPRYKQLGNSWSIFPVRWIGRRLDAHLKSLERQVITLDPSLVWMMIG